MPKRMVLSDCRTMPWLRIWTFFLELLDMKFIQLERRLSFETYRTAWSIWRCREMQAWFPSRVMLHYCDEQEVKNNIAGAQLHSGHLLL